MAFSGFKKQLNKANEFLNEKVSGAEGTKLEDEYIAMEKKIEVTSVLVEELQFKTKDYLDLNFSLLRPKSARSPVGLLGDFMVTYGQKLQEVDTNSFAKALQDTGDSMRKMADAKSNLDDSVRRDFLQALKEFQAKDLKEIELHREKVQSRRRDFDSKRRKQTQQLKTPSGGTISETEMKLSAEKFGESYKEAQILMNNLLSSDMETVIKLSALADSLEKYHLECAGVMANLKKSLTMSRNQLPPTNRTKTFVPKMLKELQVYLGEDKEISYSIPKYNPNFPTLPVSPKSPTAPDLPPWKPIPTQRQISFSPGFPSCQAVYDFVAENPNELEFRTGDTIQLLRRIDGNWFEGGINGKIGYFPVSHVKVLVPLP